jgi:hypothetical protein
MSFPWSKKRAASQADVVNPDELIQRFEKDIERHEDLLYGVALFFEGVSLFNAGQEDVMGTYRKQFRNIVQSGRNVSQQAAALLEEVRHDRSSAQLLTQFNFAFCEGHTDPEGMLKRAEVMVECYRKLFPDRPRSQPFTGEEIFRLMEEAGEELAKTRPPGN